jgi:hypothetical protein
MIESIRFTSIRFFLFAALCCSVTTAQAAQLAMNFGGNQQGGLPTASYMSTVLGTTVNTWDHEGQIDWSGGDPTNGIPPTFIESETGATISYYYDAANTWANTTVPQDSPLRGYLDDGGNNQPFVQIGGLTDWLAATGDSHWQLTVLRSTDNGSGFRDLHIRTGAIDGTWYRDTLPVTGSTNVIPGAALTPGPITMETDVYFGNSDGLVVFDPNFGRPSYRGTIAGLIIESAPGPVPVGPETFGPGSVSINMQGRNPGYQLQPGDSAGVLPTTNWNNIDNSGAVAGTFGPILLQDGFGEQIARLTWSATGTWGRTSIGGPDGDMMAGHIEATNDGTATAMVEGLSDNYSSYDVYVYVGDDAGGRQGEIRLNGGPIQNFTSKIFDGTYTLGTDYFLFSGVTGDSFTVSVEPVGDLGANRTGIRGIQVVGVPEPSSLMLSALAVLGLGLVARRRRR